MSAVDTAPQGNSNLAVVQSMPSRAFAEEWSSFTDHRVKESRFLFEELIHTSLTTVSGAPKAGKTTFALHVASAVINGTDLLGCKFNGTQGPVCYLGCDAEWRDDLVIDWGESIPEAFLFTPNGRVDLMSEGAGERLAKQILTKDVRLFIVDHLRGFSGAINLDRDHEIIPFWNNLKAIHETGIPVLLLAHSNRGENNGSLRPAHSNQIEAQSRCLIDLGMPRKLKGSTQVLRRHGNYTGDDTWTIRINRTESIERMPDNKDKQAEANNASRKRTRKVGPEEQASLVMGLPPESLLNMSTAGRAVKESDDFPNVNSEGGGRNFVSQLIAKKWLDLGGPTGPIVKVPRPSS
jgi:hypothetical protein